MKKILFSTLIIFFLLTIINKAQSTNIYVDPVNGNDSNSGTIDQPFLTITKAMSSIGSGGTIYLRGGVYHLSSTIKTSSSGKDSTAYNNLWAYPGEKPILDFSGEPFGSSSRGLTISKNYWYVKGLEIENAGDNGVNISGSHNIFEDCSIHNNQDSGMQLGGGASYNKIINCDSYFNCDPGQGNADGFAPKLNVGTGNYFYGCRSWQNSDDGWDGYMRGANNVSTTLENCWTFMNGYLEDGSKSKGNGNGFKMGGSDNKTLEHNFILRNCVSFDNRVKGFDQNNNRGSMTLINCSGYRNGNNYVIYLPLDSGKTLTLTNCLSYGGISMDNIGSFAIQTTNSWQESFTVSPEDFVSLDTTGVRGPRKADGSLPELSFLHLAAGSKLIDAGTNIGLPFSGSAPDIGAFEHDATLNVSVENYSSPTNFFLEQNFPNPFNPVTTIYYSLPKASNVKISVYNTLGEKISTLVNSYQTKGLHKVKFVGNSIASGIYFYRIEAGSYRNIKKMIFLK